MLIGLGLFVPLVHAADDSFPTNPSGWPATTRETRPWAYNWWLGSAVDTNNLTRELQRYKDGGLGGVHIIPIYGADGAKKRYIKFLSGQWMDMLQFCIDESAQLDLGVDMTTGTGWCFGGPNVPEKQGGWHLETRTVELAPGQAFSEKLDAAHLIALIAETGDGKCADIRPRLSDSGQLNWSIPGRKSKLYFVTAFPSGPPVKRAAPGGMGLMINPFDPAAMTNYLARFTEVFNSYHGPLPRAMYHDSYEYNSSWSETFLSDFAQMRGYRLEDHWPAFCGDPGQSDEAARVRADFKETLSDLMVDRVFPEWIQWCHARGILTRYQAHGSPADLLDLYALSDIPETEMFGRGDRDPMASGFDARFGEGDRDPLISKVASSAAHLAGRKFASSETGTWMAEHFCETLEEMKCLVDLLFSAGINHVFYHGTCYSPDDVPWPGWLFYAATEMNPRNALWHDVPALNAYITRCQSILQSGRPDNDILLYWPIHDFWQTDRALVSGLTVHRRDWLEGQPFGVCASFLWQKGYSFDYLSDRLLKNAKANGRGKVIMGGNEYQVILVPACQLMPADTLERLLDLAKSGATVIFEKHLPQDVPGWGDLDARRAAFHKTLESVALLTTTNAPISYGKGRLLVGDMSEALRVLQIPRESIADHEGTRFIRRLHDEGRHYFIANQGSNAMSGWFALGTPARSVMVLDPMTGRSGILTSRTAQDGSVEIPLRLEPGQSIVLRTFERRKVRGRAWNWQTPGPMAIELPGPWKVEFLEGGPQLPDPCQMETLKSWTLDGDPKAENFSGTAVYRTEFDAPAGKGPWLLDLGKVCHGARVRLNGADMGTLFMKPYRIPITSLKPHANHLEVEVSNLSANRLRDLDRRKVPWRKFYFVNIHYRTFDASNWPVMDSGLIGPVKLMSVLQ